MKRYLTVACASATLLLTACGGSGAVTATHLAKDPKIQRDKQILTKQAQDCFKGTKSLGKAGRTEFLQCFVPAERKVTAQKCLQKELKRHGVPVRRKTREQFLTNVADCIVTT